MRVGFQNLPSFENLTGFGIQSTKRAFLCQVFTSKSKFVFFIFEKKKVMKKKIRPKDALLFLDFKYIKMSKYPKM